MSTVASSFIGKGFDSISRDTKDCSALPKLKNTIVLGPKAYFTSSFTQHFDQTAKEAVINATVQARTSIVNLEGRAQFDNVVNKDRNELIYVVRFRTIDEEFEIDGDVSFSEESQGKLVKNPEEFFRLYGDSYVSKVGYGKELRIVVKFNLDGKTDKQKYMAELNLKQAGGIIGAGTLYNLSTTLIHKKINCDVELHSSGGKVELSKKITDLQELLTWIEGIGEQCMTGSFGTAKPVPLFLGTTSYTSVKFIPVQGVDPANFEKNVIAGKLAICDMIQYTTKYLKNILICKERASYLLGIPQSSQNKEILEKVHSELRALIESISQEASLSKKMDLIKENKDKLKDIRLNLDKIKELSAKKIYYISEFIPRVSNNAIYKHKINSKQLELFKEMAEKISVSEPFTFAFKETGYFKRQVLSNFDDSGMQLNDAPKPNTTITDMKLLKRRKLYITTSNKGAAAEIARLTVTFPVVADLKNIIVEPKTPISKPS